jgi:3-phytase
MRRLLVMAGAGALGACAAAPQGLPPVAVYARSETAPVGEMNEDAADDPAIWRNATDPLRSLIVATDKRAGLYVYGMDGAVKSFLDAGRVNNVDLVQMGTPGIVVVASDRNDEANAKLQVFRLDPASGELAALDTGPGGTGEGYGLCLHAAGGDLLAYSVLKDGTIQEVRIAFAEQVIFTLLRTLAVPTQAEGCVVDPRNGTLYVGEENVGIWRFGPQAIEGELVAPVDNRYLVADVEGLTMAPEGADGGYLVASSQGDNAYAVYALPSMTPVGRFRIAEGALGATEETDGIALVAQSFGPEYPAGLFVAQDGQNGARAQNFKLVSWADVKAALGLD